MFGVSPAYFISRFTDRFSPEDVAKGLPDLAAAGFDAFQLEVFHTCTLEQWLHGGARAVRKAAENSGLAVSQFVGHFLLNGFSTPETLLSDFGPEETEKILELLSHFPECGVVTAALPAFASRESKYLKKNGFSGLRNRFEDKIGELLAVAETGGKRLALEIMPMSILGGTEGFLRLRERLQKPSLGYNFDTGHAWACRENPAFIPARLGGDSLLGTHLKDNFQTENLALGPGKGSIPWPEVVEGLLAAGYSGSWDLEIKCGAAEAKNEYETALRFLRPLLEEARKRIGK